MQMHFYYYKRVSIPTQIILAELKYTLRNLY